MDRGLSLTCHAIMNEHYLDLSARLEAHAILDHLVADLVNLAMPPRQLTVQQLPWSDAPSLGWRIVPSGKPDPLFRTMR
jgi:hypothetical protein